MGLMQFGLVLVGSIACYVAHSSNNTCSAEQAQPERPDISSTVPGKGQHMSLSKVWLPLHGFVELFCPFRPLFIFFPPTEFHLHVCQEQRMNEMSMVVSFPQECYPSPWFASPKLLSHFVFVLSQAKFLCLLFYKVLWKLIFYVLIKNSSIIFFSEVEK